MGVEITQDELDIFSKNGISEDDIRNTVNTYRNEGVSDEEIRAKFNDKLNSFQSQEQYYDDTQTQTISGSIKKYDHPIKKGIVQAGRNVARFLLPKKAENWFLGSKEDEEFLKQHDDNNTPTYEELQNDYKDGYITKEQFMEGLKTRSKYNELKADREYRDVRNKNIGIGALSIGTAFIPTIGAARGVGLAAQGLKGIGQAAKMGALNGAIGGGIYGLGESIIDEDKNVISNTLSNAGAGAAFGGVLGGGTNAVAQGVKRKLAQKAAQKGKNIVNDVTENAAETVGKTENIIPQENIKVGADIPENAQVKQAQKPNTFYNDKTAKKAQKDIKQEINDIKVQETKLDYVTRRYKNRYFKQNVSDPLTQSLHEADQELNTIIEEIKKDPSIINDINKIEAFEQRLEKKCVFPDDELTHGYFSKFYEAIEKAGDYNQVGTDLSKANSMRTAGELKRSKLPQSADLPKDVSKMANAPENAAEYEVLHNDDLIAQSKKMVDNDAEILKSDLLKRAGEKGENFEALDFENARQLVTKMLNEGRTEEALDLIESVASKGSKAGQAVQAMSLWSLQTPEGAILQGQKIINKYNKNVKNPSKKIPNLTEDQAKELARLANEVLQQTDDRSRDVATAKLLKYQAELIPVSGWQKAKTLRNISLLLNPKTLGRNIVGNGLFAGIEGVSKTAAAGIDNLLSNATGKRTRVMPQFKELFKGAKKGTQEGFEDAIQGIDTRAGIGGRFDLPTQRSFRDPILGNLETALDVGLRVPDRTFYQGVMEESIANQLKAQGLKEATPEIIEQARKEALEAVFQDDSTISKGILGARKALNNVSISPEFGLGDLVIPYAQTPANIIQQGINYSPFGFLKSGVNLAKGNQRQGTLDLARALVGSGLMGAGYAGAENGLISGDIEDYKLRKNLETINERPFQITLPNGSKMSYSQLQPVSIPLSAGTALAQQDKEKAAQAALGTLLDLPMLDTIGKAVQDTQNYGVGTAAVNMGMGFPTQFVPTAVNQLNAYIDPNVRETYDPNPIMRGLNQARNKIPFISKTLPLKYDVTGQPVEKYQSEGLNRAYDVFLNPVFINKPKDDLVMQEVAAITEVTGENGGLLNIPEKKIKLDDGTTKELSNKEFSEYSKMLGELSYRGYKAVMNTPRYQNADDTTRLKLLGDIKTNAKAIVQEEMFGKVNKHSAKGSLQNKIDNRLNKGQRKIDRLFNKMDSQLIDSIMYKE